MWLKGKIEVLPKTVVFTGRDIFDICFIAWNWPQIAVIMTNMLECECIPSFQCVSSSDLRSNYWISFSHLGSLLNMCMLLLPQNSVYMMVSALTTMMTILEHRLDI